MVDCCLVFFGMYLVDVEIVWWMVCWVVVGEL